MTDSFMTAYRQASTAVSDPSILLPPRFTRLSACTALHFKLAISSGSGRGNTTSLESAEFQYTPLLDPNRDKRLITLLPEYLTVDITFSRQNAAKFYNKVADTLMRKPVD